MPIKIKYMKYALSWSEVNKKENTWLSDVISFGLIIGIAILAHILFIILIP